ncbi:MAG: hypothetical protein OEM82_12265, partial [Acidobacteriota bacterium]|nr:hypothetical protein [Acidobacteriota bacterium]
KSLPKRIDKYPSLRDYYNDYDQYEVTDDERKAYDAFVGTLDKVEKSLLNADYYFYVVDLKNIGGLVMPVIFGVEYMDGTSEKISIPAEIWRYDNFNVSKLIVAKKEVKAIVLDPNLETADSDLANNFFPRRTIPTRFQVFKSQLRSDLEPSAAADSTPVENVALDGRWVLNIAAPGQAVTLEVDLVTSGETVAGSISTPQGQMAISSGSVKNGALTLKTTTPIELVFTGQLRGSFLSGTVTAPQGTTTFTGAKVD